MARIRSIKPEFWTDEKVVSLSPLARLLFIGMWNFADDFGRGEYSPLRMKMQILPADSADIAELLGEIRREGLVEVYTVESKDYFAIRGFAKHQKVDHRVASKHPAPPSSTNSPRNPPPDQGEDQGREEEKNTEANASSASAPSTVVSLDPSRMLFGDGLNVLASISGKSAQSLRSQVGRWVQMSGKDHVAILRLIQSARDQNIIDPVAWIEASLKPKDPDADIYRAVL